MDCPVCSSDETRRLDIIDGLRYLRCERCLCTFLHPAQRLGAEEERARYLLHENDPSDPCYRRFLSRLADPLLERLSPGALVLDYGCGPGPALAAMLEEAGHEVRLYDPFFFPDRSVLDDRYDAVTCTEVAEHFHRPAEEFDLMARLVRPGSWLAVMTCFQRDDTRFAGWSYRRDPSHVIFYREETFRLLSSERGFDCEFPAENVALMERRINGARRGASG